MLAYLINEYKQVQHVYMQVQQTNAVFDFVLALF